MTDGTILAAAGVRAIDPDYEPTTLAGRWATCYDARHHRYVTRYVQPLGLRPVKARRGDEELAYDSLIADEGVRLRREALERKLAADRAKIDAELDELEALLRKTPMDGPGIAERFGRGHDWMRRLTIENPDRFCPVYRIRRRYFYGVVGVSYKLPRIAKLIVNEQR